MVATEMRQLGDGARGESWGEDCFEKKPREEGK